MESTGTAALSMARKQPSDSLLHTSREREREIYVFSVVTGSSLRNYAQEYDKTGRYLQYVFKDGL